MSRSSQFSQPQTQWGWKWRMWWGRWRMESSGARLAKFASGLVILGFSIGATLFFRYVFSGILKLEGIGEPLLWRTLSLAWGAVFMLLIISNLITGIATLYRSPELAFLFSHPISYRHLFLSRWVDNLAYSSWSLMVLGFPLLVAWGWALKVKAWWVIGAMVAGLIPLIVIAAVVGSFLLMLLVIIARKVAPWVSVLLIVLTLSGGIGYLTYARSVGVVVEGKARTSVIERYLSQLRRGSGPQFLPSQWLTQFLYHITQKRTENALLLGLLLLLTAIVWLRWLYLLSGSWYFPTWEAFFELGRSSFKHQGERGAKRFIKSWLPHPWGPLLGKDLALFRRTPSQWGQFLILVGFLLIYLLNLILVSRRFDFDHPYYKTLVFFLNFAFSGFVLATLAVRFVYPLISLEGKGFWVVKSAPIRMSQVFTEKFLLSFVAFLTLCEIIVIFSNSVLNFHHYLSIFTSLATLMMGIALTGLSIGLGALYPDFKEENPMRIASTPGGVMTVVISLIYVGIVVGMIYSPVRGYLQFSSGLKPFPYLSTLLSWVALVGLNVLITLIPLRLGLRNLEQRDL